MSELAGIMGHQNFETVQIYAKALEANKENKMLNFSFKKILMPPSTVGIDLKVAMIKARAEMAINLIKNGYTPEQASIILNSVS